MLSRNRRYVAMVFVLALFVPPPAEARGAWVCRLRQVLSLEEARAAAVGELARCRVWLRNGAERVRGSCVGQFTAGLFCDGPRDTWRGIKRNPKMFLAGLALTGAFGVVGSACGLPAHAILVCASAGTAGLDIVQTCRYEYRHAASRAQKARLLGKMAWLPSLVVGTAFAGGAVYQHSTGPATSSSITGTSLQFLGGLVTGGDTPVAAVTAVEHAQKPPPAGW